MHKMQEILQESPRMEEVRSPCRIKRKTNRAKWKAAFHKRKWIQRAARKIAKGDHSDNHTPKIMLEQGKQKWLCTTCGAYAARPTDLGGACPGPPAPGSCRYWRSPRQRLTKYELETPITSGRNANRPGTTAAPAEPGLILRLFREAQRPRPGLHTTKDSTATHHKKAAAQRELPKQSPRQPRGGWSRNRSMRKRRARQAPAVKNCSGFSPERSRSAHF